VDEPDTERRLEVDVDESDIFLFRILGARLDTAEREE
jgi:hypothetical protein